MKKNIWILNHYASDMHLLRHFCIAKYLKKQGYQPVIFCSNAIHNTNCKSVFDNNNLWNEKVADDIEVPYIYVKSRAYIGNGKQRILNMLDFYRNVKKVVKEYAIIHGNPDIIYASSAHPLTVVAGIKLAKYFGIQCICEVRDLWPESIVAYGIAGPHNPAVIVLRKLEKWIYKKSDAIVFTMENAYAYIEEQGWEEDIPRSKVHYINNGIDLESFEYDRIYYTIHDEDLDNPNIFKVVYAGSIRIANNLKSLVEAAELLEDPNVKIIIYGDGDERPKLEQYCAEKKLSNIVFKGQVEKKYIPSILSKGDLSVLNYKKAKTLKYGGSQNKLFEYLAAGHPVLLTVDMNYNIVTSNDCGATLNDPYPKEIAKAIEHFASMPKNKLEDMGKRAKEVAKEYDFKVLTDKLLKIIDPDESIRK